MWWQWFHGCLVTVAIVMLQRCLVSAHTMYEHVTHKYNYNRNPNDMLGVFNWPTTFNSDCAGAHQSPVDIRTDLAVYRQSMHCPAMTYQNTEVLGTLKNNGQSVAFELHHVTDVQLYNIPYRTGLYYLHDLHLHFQGAESNMLPFPVMRNAKLMSSGSEHTIDGRQFDGEVHFVFYNSMYMDRGDDQADDKPDGIVVIAVMVQKLAPGAAAGSPQAALLSDFMERQIPLVSPLKMNASMSVDLSMFLYNPCEFYTYHGSLTTPRCHEVVRWIIVREPLRVTDRAWSQLAGLQMEDTHSGRFGNCRPTQPLNDRVVETNFLPRTTPNSASFSAVQNDVRPPITMTSLPVIRDSPPSNFLPGMMPNSASFSVQNDVRPPITMTSPLVIRVSPPPYLRTVLQSPISLTYTCLLSDGRIVKLSAGQLVSMVRQRLPSA